MKLISFSNALNKLLQEVNGKFVTLYVDIFDSLSFVLAEDIFVTKNLPSFDNSAMDGYVVKIDDIGKKVHISGTILAGEFIDFELKSGECYKIMTGAMTPNGAEAVVKKEDILDINGEFVTLPTDIKESENIRFKGEEQKEGAVLLSKGTLITSNHIAMLSSQGISKLKVHKKPKIAIISSGDEIVEPWEEAQNHQIYNINSSAIKSLLNSFGFDGDYIKSANDDLDSLVEMICEIKSSYDVIITSGGVSVGDADFMKIAMQKNSLEEVFHGVNIKPGKPFLFGKFERSYLFGLPGNPLSTYLNLFIFVIPALFKLSNANEYHMEFVYARLNKDLNFKGDRTNLVLGNLKSGEFEPILNIGSSMVTALSQADAVLVTEISLKKDSFVKILPFKAIFSSSFSNFKEIRV